MLKWKKQLLKLPKEEQQQILELFHTKFLNVEFQDASFDNVIRNATICRESFSSSQTIRIRDMFFLLLGITPFISLDYTCCIC